MDTRLIVYDWTPNGMQRQKDGRFIEVYDYKVLQGKLEDAKREIERLQSTTHLGCKGGRNAKS